MSLRGAFLVVLALAGLTFAVRGARVTMRDHVGRPTPYELFVGVLTDFLDTLGIGSFAVTTSLYRARRTVDDRLLPGTMNVGHTLPTFAQALIYVAIVDVEPVTLLAMIASAIVGAWLGAGVVSRLPLRAVRLGLGIAMLVAAGMVTLQALHALPGGGEARGLDGTKLLVGCAANLVFGALMTLGVGLYAPCMIAVSLLGMSPATAFPIMMGSCALLMVVASQRFIAAKAYAPRAALGLALGGTPAVLFAAYVVRSLPLDAVRALVVLVVVVTAAALLRAAWRASPARS